MDIFEITILDYRLVCIEHSCPEQYDVYKNGKLIAYLRLRDGIFTCKMSNDWSLIYKSYSQGYDEFLEDERIEFLTQAIQALDIKLKKN